MNALRWTIFVLAVACLGAAHCDEPCPRLAEKKEEFNVRDDHAIGAQVLRLNMREGGGVDFMGIRVTADRPVVVALVRSSVPAELRAIVAEPTAIASSPRMIYPNLYSPILGSYRVLATLHTPQGDVGSENFAIDDAVKRAGYDALLIAPMDPKSNASYSLNVSVQQSLGDDRIRGDHGGHCLRERRPPLPDRFVPVEPRIEERVAPEPRP